MGKRGGQSKSAKQQDIDQLLVQLCSEVWHGMVWHGWSMLGLPGALPGTNLPAQSPKPLAKVMHAISWRSTGVYGHPHAKGVAAPPGGGWLTCCSCMPACRARRW